MLSRKEREYLGLPPISQKTSVVSWDFSELDQGFKGPECCYNSGTYFSKKVFRKN